MLLFRQVLDQLSCLITKSHDSIFLKSWLKLDKLGADLSRLDDGLGKGFATCVLIVLLIVLLVRIKLIGPG